MERLGPGLPTRPGAGVDAGAGLLERIAFWTAVALPCLHVPLLLAVGLSRPTAGPLVAMWLLHALCLVVGAGHEPSDRPK